MARDSSKAFYVGLGRAAGGSILFTLPMLMTMEMWSLGFYMDPLRLALMLLLSVPLLTGLAFHSGFLERLSVRGAAIDSMVAIAVGAATAMLTLTILGIIRFDMALLEVIGKITVQTIPGAMGAVLASSQVGSNEQDQEDNEDSGRVRSYWGELFLMAAGALFFAFNLAPTEEMVVIAHGMSVWHTLLTLIVSIAIMHAFVYLVGFEGQEVRPEGNTWWAAFSRFTLTGYAIALGVSFYCLWSFGRTNGDDPSIMLTQAIVLGFPAAVGAAAGRLII